MATVQADTLSLLEVAAARPGIRVPINGRKEKESTIGLNIHTYNERNGTERNINSQQQQRNKTCVQSIMINPKQAKNINYPQHPKMFFGFVKYHTNPFLSIHTANKAHRRLTSKGAYVA